MDRILYMTEHDDMCLEEGLSVFAGFWGVEYSEVSLWLKSLVILLAVIYV